MFKNSVAICFLFETVFRHVDLGSDNLTFIFIANTVDKTIHMLKEQKAIIFVKCKR